MNLAVAGNHHGFPVVLLWPETGFSFLSKAEFVVSCGHGAACIERRAITHGEASEEMQRMRVLMH